MTTPTISAGWRNTFDRWVTWWMSNRPGLTVLYRVLWVVVASFDGQLQIALMGVRSAWPGAGTPTALAMIGRSRGLIRGIGESDNAFAKWLRGWRQLWKTAGSQLAIAKVMQHYAGNAPIVKVVNRQGVMTTLASDGTVTIQTVTWDWDSLSHGFRYDLSKRLIPGTGILYWSEQFVIIYTPPWGIAGPLGTSIPVDSGIGQLCPRVDVDAIRGELAQWKGAHSYVRCLIWAYDATMFNPAAPATMPDGTWGSWSFNYGTRHRQASGRGLAEIANKIRCWVPDDEPAENLPFHP